MSGRRGIVGPYRITAGLALLVGLAGCGNAAREKDLQTQLDQMRSEKTSSDQAHQQQVQTLQKQIEQMQADKTASDAANAEKERRNRLVGTWRYRGSTTLETTYKLVTPTHWAMIEFNTTTGQISKTKGGTYTLSGDEYVESFEYDSSASPTSHTGGSHSPFTCEIDGDTWHHHDAKSVSNRTDPATGKQVAMYWIDETWDRVR